MSFINQFPYSDFHELNLDWIIRTVKALESEMKDFKVINQMTFEGTWDITKQYKPYSIVFDYDSGYSYLSKRPVPAGVPISDPDYWFLVGPLIIDSQARTSIELILRFITNNYEAGTLATSVRSAGDYVIANGTLYKVTQTINIGEAYTEGYNVESYTVEDMISDNFPVSTDQIADDAVTTDKIADGSVTTDKLNAAAVTTSKIADGSVTKQKNAADKYLFIGDSWNADYHYSWGTKLATLMDLTLNSDYWNVAVPGGGFGNGLVLTAVQTAVGAMSAAEKSSITKVLIVLGANDAAYSSSTISSGLTSMETYLTGNLPNAEIYLVAGQWGFETATFRTGLLNAYNTYGENCGKMKFFDKCYLEFMDPYFLDSDFIHPTENGQNIFIHTLKNILNGGNYYERKYSDLVSYVQMSDYYGTLSSGGTVWSLKGDISRAGTHVYTEGNAYIIFTGGYWMQYNSPSQIGVIGSNNLFQRKAELKTTASVVYQDGGNNKRVLVPATVIIERNGSGTLEVFLRFDTSIDGNNTRNIQQVYLPLDQMLDFTKT